MNAELGVPMPHLSFYHADRLMHMAREIGIKTPIDTQHIEDSLRTHSLIDLYALHTAVVDTPKTHALFPVRSGGLYGRRITNKQVGSLEQYNLQHHIQQPINDNTKLFEFHYTPLFNTSRPQFHAPTPGIRRATRILLPFDITRGMEMTKKIMDVDNSPSNAYIYGATSSHFASFLERSLGFHTYKNIASLKRILFGSTSVWMPLNDLLSSNFQEKLQNNIQASARYFDMTPETLEKESRIFAILQGMRQKMNMR